MRRDRAIGPLVKRSHQVPWPVISEAWQRHVITKPFSAESIHIFSQLMFARDFLGIHGVVQPKMAMALQQLHHDILESGYLKYPTCKFQICPKLPKSTTTTNTAWNRSTSDPVTSGEKSPTSPKKIRLSRPRWRDIHWVDCRIPHAQARPSLVPVMALAPGGKQHLMGGFDLGITEIPRPNKGILVGYTGGYMIWTIFWMLGKEHGSHFPNLSFPSSSVESTNHFRTGPCVAVSRRRPTNPRLLVLEVVEAWRRVFESVSYKSTGFFSTLS